MICPNYLPPQFLLYTNQIPPLIYYSHFSAIIALVIGLFVYIKNKSSLQSKTLFFISVVFLMWALSDLVLWTNNDSGRIMFFWSFLGMFSIAIAILCFYFVYVFLHNKDLPFKLKLLLVSFLFPIIFLTPTKFNLLGFNLDLCGAAGFEGTFFIYYKLLLNLLMFFGIIVLSVRQYKEANTEFKKQILLLTGGVSLFLFSFFTSTFIASYLTSKGIIDNFEIEQYGYFAMTFFMGVIAYLIVKYKAFNIKLLGAQALVVAIIILIGSQFFFIKSTTNMILTGITFVMISVFGWWLVRSVKTENSRREQLQYLADQLAGSNSKLQKMDNTKTEFISIASHQLRTPPTAIKGYASLLLEGSYGKLQPDQLYALNNIYRRNEDMILLIDNLLNTSRIEAGTMAFDFEKFKMEDLLQDIYETLIIKAKTNKLSLEVIKPAVAVPEVTTDKAKFKETLSNLVENAIKYTKQGGVKVEMALQKGFTVLSHESSNPTPVAGAELRDPEKDVVRIVVSDTGIGIPENELPFLFQKFSRGKDITRLNVSGTGLGLFVGKKIMEQLGGQVWAESPGAGKGSRFIVEIPVEGKEKV